MRDQFRLAPVSEDDAEALLALYVACEDFLALGPQPRASLDMVLADLAASRQANGRYEGIFVGGALVGVVDYVLAGHEGEPGHAYLALLMLAPAWRRRGLGAAVTRYVEAMAAAGGATHVCLGAQVNNPMAVRFWQRLGYAIYAGPVAFADGTTAWQLRKALVSVA